MTEILAPLAGTVADLSQVPDPVFSAGLVGPGGAIEPDTSAGSASVTVVAPVAGTIAKMHPHAFVIARADGTGVLVHLGIDTVQLEGRGFTLHAAQGDQVSSGQPLISWNPAEVIAGGRSAICPVVVLDAEPETVSLTATVGEQIPEGHPLLRVDA